MDPVSSIRIDKWLWAARFFKTRAHATRACELGRIETNGLAAKASREVRAGDQLKIRNESGEFQIEVVAVSALRGPAATGFWDIASLMSDQTFLARVAKAVGSKAATS